MANDRNQDASRVIMLVETSNYLNRLEAQQFSIFFQKFHLSATKTLKEFDGIILSKDNNSYLISFASVGDAVLCAVKIQFKFKYVTPKFDANIRRLNIAMVVDPSKTIDQAVSRESLIRVTRMCEVVNGQVVVSSAVKGLYEGDTDRKIDKEHIRCLKVEEESFLKRLIDYLETNWNQMDLDVGKMTKDLNYTSSQLYRKVKRLTGLSSNAFIREFRLHKALELLHNNKGNITEVADRTGFKSLSYFSKAFRRKYGILPSRYSKQHSS